MSTKWNWYVECLDFGIYTSVYKSSYIHIVTSFLGSKASSKDCNLFQPVVTNHGLCQAFNPTPSLEILKPSYFTESLAEALNYDFIPNYILRNATGSGKKHSLDFIVLGNNFRTGQIGGQTKFKIGLSSGK